jgi:hypothetical protein
MENHILIVARVGERAVETRQLGPGGASSILQHGSPDSDHIPPLSLSDSLRALAWLNVAS